MNWIWQTERLIVFVPCLEKNCCSICNASFLNGILSRSSSCRLLDWNVGNGSTLIKIFYAWVEVLYFCPLNYSIFVYYFVLFFFSFLPFFAPSFPSTLVFFNVNVEICARKSWSRETWKFPSCKEAWRRTDWSYCYTSVLLFSLSAEELSAIFCLDSSIYIWVLEFTTL